MTTNHRRAGDARARTATRGRAGASGRGRWSDRAAAWLVSRATVADRDRGDVPGWVLVTLMTAGLVTVLWAVALPALENVFDAAIKGVTKP